MRHRKRRVVLGRRSGPRAALFRNLTVSVLLHERVHTTAAKARAVRPLVERCITIGKGGTLTQRRALLALLTDQRAVRKTIEVLSPRYRDRSGGYTRVTKIGRRVGDDAPVVQLELV